MIKIIMVTLCCLFASSNVCATSNRAPLENYNIEKLRFVGTVLTNDRLSALILAPDNTLHIARKGDHIGSNKSDKYYYYNKITTISAGYLTYEYLITINGEPYLTLETMMLTGEYPTKENIHIANGSEGHYQGENISVFSGEVPIRGLLDILGYEVGQNFIASGKVEGHTNLYVEGVPWPQALNVILLNKGLAETLYCGIHLISTPEDIAYINEVIEINPPNCIKNDEVFSFSFQYIKLGAVFRLIADFTALPWKDEEYGETIMIRVKTLPWSTVLDATALINGLNATYKDQITLTPK